MIDFKEKGDKGEEFVNNLAYSSFMKYWCHANVFKADKKECCDLLILFEPFCLIIETKNHTFKERSTTEKNHEKYFKDALQKACKQVNGAESYIFNNKGEIFIKKNTDSKEPNFEKLNFDFTKYKHIFKIIIHLGEPVFYPNQILIENKEEYVTILNGEAFSTLIKYLDTIPDFINYLFERKRVFENKHVILIPNKIPNKDSDSAQKELTNYENSLSETEKNKRLTIKGAEEDLLATYIANDKKNPIDPADLKENYTFYWNWERFINSDSAKSKRNKDKISYEFDRRINEFILPYSNDNPEEIQRRETLAKEFLSLNRFQRRTIMQALNEFYNNNIDAAFYSNERWNRNIPITKTELKGCFLPHQNQVPTRLVFMVFPANCPEEFKKGFRKIYSNCLAVHDNYQYKKMLMITKDPHTFDFDCEFINAPFSEQDEKHFKEDIEIFGFFKDKPIRTVEYKEF